MKILGIESSCDETCASVVEDGRTILSNVVSSQIDTHALYGGVVPEIASRAHAESIQNVVEKALTDSNTTLDDIDAIAVTSTPGLIGSLLVGVNFAKGLSYSCNKPLIPVHHIKGHVAANYAYFNGENGQTKLEPPFVALVVSGGHTSLIKVSSYTDYKVVGSTRDDAAGECFDKVARMLGLQYPGGAKMDACAKSGNASAFQFPDAKVKDSPLDFSFSGLKTSAVNLIHNAEQKGEILSKEDVCASFTSAVIKSIISRLENLFSEDSSSDKLVLAGGVAANSHLRKAISDLCEKRKIDLFIPPLSLCGDNAVMIASQAYYEYTKENNCADLSLNAHATCDIETKRV